METPSRMVVNAAIEELIKGTDNWKEHAKTILSFAQTMRVTAPVAFCSTTKEEGSSVSGLTDTGKTENITPASNGQTTERSFGYHKERVGYYKLERRTSNLLRVQGWWQADESTVAEKKADEFFLIHDPVTFEPICCYQEESVDFLNFRIFSIGGNYLTPVYGNAKRKLLSIFLGPGW